jgi:DNA repair protein RadD
MTLDFSEIIMPILRTYQLDLTGRVRQTCRVIREPIRVIIQASTGAGKSVIALYLMLCAYQRGKRCLFMVSGRLLVDQIEKHLQRANVSYGVIMAGRGRNEALIQIASKETLGARLVRDKRMKLPEADLLIIDEAHESMAGEWVKLIHMYEKAVILGLTATPALGNGKGLGKIYGAMEKAISTAELVAQKWLVPCIVFAPEKPDLRGIKIVNGDYHKEQLASRMDKPKLVGNVLENWKKHADGKKTVIFGCNIAHAKHIQDEFLSAGIRFGHIDQTTEDNEREDIFGEIENGRMMGFTNVSVARRGLDLPCLEVACVVRPTKSLVLWLQMIGRIRRPWPGKEGCTVIDHAGACDFHCMPDDEIDWSLDSERKIGDWLEERNADPKTPKKVLCPKCACMFTGKRCPNCGFEFAEPPQAENTIEHADGILVERDGRDKPSLAEMQKAFNSAIGFAVHKNRKAGAAARIFSNRFGFPPWDARPRLANLPKRKKGSWQQPAVVVWPNFRHGPSNGDSVEF